MKLLSKLLCSALLLLLSTAHAELVALPLPDGTALRAHWFPAPGTGASRPTVVALHGCGGLYARDGATLDARYPDYVEFLHERGINVLLPDSFGSRGVKSICTQPNRGRSIKVATRRGDVLAALDWVARQPQVDAQRVALLGWSNGGSTLLETVAAGRPDAPRLAGAIAFYPGCNAIERRAGYAVDAPLLMLLGAADDWTPPAPCERLARRLAAAKPAREVRVVSYPEAVHGFDSTRPVRWRGDVPNGTDPAGVHQGGNPVARAAARAELDLFLQRIFQP